MLQATYLDLRIFNFTLRRNNVRLNHQERFLNLKKSAEIPYQKHPNQKPLHFVTGYVLFVKAEILAAGEGCNSVALSKPSETTTSLFRAGIQSRPCELDQTFVLKKI